VQDETRDPGEVIGVAGVEREPVGDRRRSNERVERHGGRLPSRPAQRGGDLAEGACGGRVERQRVEVRLGLLHVRQAAGTLDLVVGHEGPD
jgi:hypothetical protein